MPDDEPKQCDLDPCTNEAVEVTKYGARCEYHNPDVFDDTDERAAQEEAYYTDDHDHFGHTDHDTEHAGDGFYWCNDCGVRYIPEQSEESDP